MPAVFISHVEEDQQLALDLAPRLEEAGYTTWYYERDSPAGASFMSTIPQAIQDARAILVLVSPHTLASATVHCELVHAHNNLKPFLPVLCGLSYAELVKKKIEWAFIFADKTAIEYQNHDLAALTEKIYEGLKARGIDPSRRLGGTTPTAEERLHYYEQVLQHNPHDVEAWFYKGVWLA